MDKKLELLNPKNDYVFKRIFGYKGNENITKQMLSTILKRKINSIKLDENTILEKDLINDKVGIIDVHAKIDDTIDVDIEMQVIEQKSIEKRIMFYWSKLYIKGIEAGNEYSKLNKTIVVLITDSKIPKLKDIPDFYTKWQIREEKYTSVILTEMLEICIIELSKTKKEIHGIEREIRAWIDFLENPKDMEMVNMSKQNTIAIREAKKVLEEISKDKYERYLAELREKYIRDQKAVEQFGFDSGMEEGIERGLKQGLEEGREKGLKQGIERGLKQGLEEGREKGLKQGIEKGLKQGLEEGMKNEKEKIAKKLLQQNIDINTIISVTGLTKEKIKKL